MAVGDLLRANAEKLFWIHDAITTDVSGGMGTRITVQFNLFAGSIANLGDARQRCGARIGECTFAFARMGECTFAFARMGECTFAFARACANARSDWCAHRRVRAYFLCV